MRNENKQNSVARDGDDGDGEDMDDSYQNLSEVYIEATDRKKEKPFKLTSKYQAALVVFERRMQQLIVHAHEEHAKAQELARELNAPAPNP